MTMYRTLTTKIKYFGKFVKRVLALSAPYFKSEDKWKACSYLAMIIVLNLAAVYMLVLLNEWNRVFYDALQNKDAVVFWEQLGRFAYLAFVLIIIAVYRFYMTQLLQVRWREWMTTNYLQRWLSGHAFYTLELSRFTSDDKIAADNPDQRIQEDIYKFTAHTVSLSMGFLNSVVTLLSFVGILWALSGTFSFMVGTTLVSIPGFMVWMAVLYCAVGSVLAHYIGRPQIKLNFDQQRYEADFRHHMVRVREYSESIALDKGEAVERNQLNMRFSMVLANYLTLIKKQKNLVWFTNFFNQAAIVFPFIVAAPRFFSGAIQLGGLMQVASAFGRVQGALDWFVGEYSNLAEWRATTDRLTSFEDSIMRVTIQARITNHASSDRLTTDNLSIALPSGKVVLSGTTVQAGPGDLVLLRGPSGCGKSTLFRSLAGIWPFVSGSVNLPDNTMFIPQRPYFPNGTLRTALAYPEPANTYADEDLIKALNDALLPMLTTRLDDADAWGQKLSGGEQQRLAIARVLLKKPRWILADEATASLDVATEKSLYKKLTAHVKSVNGGIVSIAHRPSVSAFHNIEWELVKRSDNSQSLENHSTNLGRAVKAHKQR